MLGEDMMNVTDEVMIDGVDVICAEHCDVEYFGCVDAIDCSVVDVGVEDDGNEVVIVGCHEVGDGDDGDDEMLGEDMMNVTDEVMIDGVDVICAEHCDVEYFDLVNFVICDVDENDFVVFEDDGNEVVIVGCHEV
ncbi:hypothetical protein MN116_001176, partial [Schistosoma mekongi]